MAAMKVITTSRSALTSESIISLNFIDFADFVTCKASSLSSASISRGLKEIGDHIVERQSVFFRPTLYIRAMTLRTTLTVVVY